MHSPSLAAVKLFASRFEDCFATGILRGRSERVYAKTLQRNFCDRLRYGECRLSRSDPAQQGQHWVQYLP
jgi:hypothetical protein